MEDGRDRPGSGTENSIAAADGPNVCRRKIAIMPSLYTQRRMVDVVPRRAAQPSDPSEPRRDLQTALTNAGLQQ